MVKSIIAASCLIFCISCSDALESIKEEPDLVFNKLIGTWKLSDEDQYEQWYKNIDGSYSSRSFAVTGKDTTIMEEVKIVPEGGKWNFITLVKGQNKGKAVTFTSSLLQDTLVQFENPAHDFPRIVNYRLASENIMQAFIGGTNDTIYFNFSRVITK